MPSQNRFQWLDNLMEQVNPDYYFIYAQLCQMVSAPKPEESMVDEASYEVELWWRLCAVGYKLTLNYDFKYDFAPIRSKLVESKQWGEKALALAPNHFAANLWMAMTVGKLALLESGRQSQDQYPVSMVSIADMITQVRKHLTLCQAQRPDDHQVLFLDACIAVGLCCLSEEHLLQLQTNSSTANLFPIDKTAAEDKLRRAIQLAPTALDYYAALAHLLAIHMDKCDQAREVAVAGLQLERFTVDDRRIATELNKIVAMASEQQQKQQPAIEE